MKIDFNADYSGVSNLVFRKEAAQADTSVRAQFGKIMRDVERPALKELEIIKKNNIFSGTPDSTTTGANSFESAVESYAPPPPTMIIPEVARHNPQVEAYESVNTMPEPVKAPTVLEARRTNEYELPEPVALQVDPSPKEIAVSQYKGFIQSAGARHGIDPALGMAVARAESSFNPQAVSSDGHASKGLFQLLDATGKDMMGRLSVNGDYNPFDPELNTELGVGYLRYLHDLFSTEKKLPNNFTTREAANSSSLEKLAVAAFNAGEGRVASAQQRAISDGLDASQYEQVESYLPEITQNYVRNVTRYRDELDVNLSEEFTG